MGSLRGYRLALVLTLVGSCVLELVIAFLLVVRPEIEAAYFHIALTPDILSLALIMAQFAGFLALLCGVAAWKVYRRDPAGKLISILSGLYWLSFGIGLFLRHYEVQFLVMDSLRGLALIFFACRLDRVAGVPIQEPPFRPY